MELRRALLEAGSGRAASPAACRSSSYKPACRARLVPGPCALLPKAPPLTPRLSLARVQAESSSRLA